mgnify:CR=1 FL=1
MLMLWFLVFTWIGKTRLHTILPKIGYFSPFFSFSNSLSLSSVIRCIEKPKVALQVPFF